MVKREQDEAYRLSLEADRKKVLSKLETQETVLKKPSEISNSHNFKWLYTVINLLWRTMIQYGFVS